MSVTFTWQLPRNSTAPAQGRWHVRGLASDDREAVDAELVVTELITNAWKHGCGSAEISLCVEVRDESLHIEVCGEAEGNPIRAAGDIGSDPGGRGLLMIDGLTEQWGFERRGDFVCVWADVPHLPSSI